LVRTRLDELILLVGSLAGAALSNTTNEIRRLRERRLIEHLSARAFLPSYAFPIYVVELRTPDGKVKLQRDLRVAISEYAPGSQVIANKHMFESKALILKGPSAGAKTPYVDVWLCESCQAAYSQQTDECTCGAEKGLRNAKYIIPDGFMTDMTTNPGDAVARARIKQTRSSQHVLDPGEVTDSAELGPVRVSKFEQARFLFLNHGDPGEQFRICLSCGARVSGKTKGSHKTVYGRSCDGQICRCMLGHELIGEALAIQIDDGDGLVVPDDQVFHQTLSYALVEGISKALSIERRDLGVSVRRVSRSGQMRWEILVLDNVPGGAGYVAQIMRSRQLEASIREAAKIVDCGNCPEESTCYSCLRSMNNQSLHDKMQRGPVRRFLLALCERMQGNSRIFGLDVERWMRPQGLQEVFLAVPTLSDVVANRILIAGNVCDTTVVVGKSLNPELASWIDAWRKVWSGRVKVMEGNVDRATLGLKRDGIWQLVTDASTSDLSHGVLHEGLLIEGEDATRLRSEILKNAESLRLGKGLPAFLIPLEAGSATSEKELFGHLFEDVVEHVTIEDPYLFEARHEARLKSWLELPKTQTRFVIETAQPDEINLRRQQQEMFVRVKAKFGQKHEIKVAFRNKREMHDRNVRIVGQHGSRVSLPKGLDFINERGIVEKSTSITIVRDEARAAP
jgi:hypothetical protein